LPESAFVHTPSCELPVVHTSPERLQTSTGLPGVPLVSLSGLALQPAVTSKQASTAIEVRILTVSHVEGAGAESVSREQSTSIHREIGFI
jgi:hypothetical protein